MNNANPRRTPFRSITFGALLCAAATPARAQDARAAQAELASAVTRVSVAPVEPPAVCPPPDGTSPDPTLVHTDPSVLARFPLSRVYEQLLSLAGTGEPTAVDLYRQMWDALDTAANGTFDAPHCDDDGGAINGFPIDCPRPEVSLKKTDPEIFTPVALFNRFDLSPADGSHCGEYRIIYALKPRPEDPAIAGRNFIIFEGILPNPTPRCGIEACRPVVDFWQGLAKLDPTQKADGLEQFYFKGLAGFQPVVHPRHYGASGGGGYGQRSGGQIRVNMFVDFQLWQLREFHLVSRCEGPACKLVLEPVTVKTNPFQTLWNVLEPAPDARAGAFQSTFPAQSLALSNDAIAQISMAIQDTYNAGQSTSQDFRHDYEFQLGLGNPPNPFSDAIQTELATIGRTDLTPEDIARRATTQSCAGCHQLSNGAALGGKSNPTWPPSRTFVHVDESGFLSEALWCSFLPARKAVLDGFSASPARVCPIRGPVRPTIVLPPNAELPVSVPVSLTVSGRIAGPN